MSENAITVYGESGATLQPAGMLEAYLESRTLKLGESALSSKPKYLIRIDLGPSSRPNDLIGIMSFWQFPRIPGMSVIEQIYPCEDNECRGMLDAASKMGEVWFCPTCKKAWTQDVLGSGVRAFQASPEHWGETVSRYFDRLGGAVEVLVMRRKLSVQKMVGKILAGDDKEADAKYMKSHGGTDKTAIEGGYFTLAAILKDTSTGSSLSSRIASFLKGG